MKISVLILTYNRQQQLKRCIESVIAANQNGIVDEIVVVDNGSIEFNLDYKNSRNFEKLE